MAVNHETVIQAVVHYVEDVRNAMPIDKVYLFGSYANGTAGEHSDIDLCFFSSSFEDRDRLAVMRELFRLSWKYDAYDIQPCAFATSDLETGNPFVKEVLRTGKEL